jgi:CRISPR system Cascade subunit CasA
MLQYSLLDEPVISVVERSTQTRRQLTLPGVFAALVLDDIEDFPALRPHQRHVWHAFLVQVAALFLHRSRASELPRGEGSWRSALLSLTPDDPDGAAWALISPVERPAFLQPPILGGSIQEFTKTKATPDDLDMLVTARNHDVKRRSMRDARAEHWMFALLSLQTQEGVMGAPNKGISRMNGGFASRPSVGIAPGGGFGARFSRDAARLVALRGRLLEEYGAYPASGAHALLWLVPWDGMRSISLTALDIFYIEVCRRVRITSGEDGRLQAVATGTKAWRIDARTLRGQTGDGWTPLITDKQGRKALTIDTESLSYKKLIPILFPRSSDTGAAIRAPLQEIAATDDPTGLSVHVRGIVRGEGGTEGYRERRVPVSPAVRRFMIERPSDTCAAIANDRLIDVSTVARKVLYRAVLAVFTAAPLDGERQRDDDSAKARTSRVLGLFDRLVDQTFFEALAEEVDVHEDIHAALAVRSRWLRGLLGHARDLLAQCAASAPSAAMRGYRTRARARDVLELAFLRYFKDRLVDDVSLAKDTLP